MVLARLTVEPGLLLPLGCARVKWQLSQAIRVQVRTKRVQLSVD